MTIAAATDTRDRSSILEAIVAPIDLGRGAILRAVGKSVAPWMRDRDARVTIVGVLAIAVAFACTVAAPTAMLALSPVLLGVPHLVSDVRYLVARPGLHRVRLLWLAAVPLLVVGFHGGARVGLLAVPIAVIAARPSWCRGCVALLAWLVAYVVAWRVGSLADLVLVHLHNVIAIAIWWAWRPGRPRRQWIVPLAFVLASVAIACGVADSIVVRGGGLGSSWIDLRDVAWALAPVESATLALRLVLLYAFAQSVHYAVWLRLVPEDDRPRRAPRTFAASLRALRLDLGAPLLAVAIVASFALAAFAVVDLVAARNGYLCAAQFHGYLELAAVAYLGLRPRAS